MNERERLRMLLPLYDSDELTPQEKAAVDDWLQREPAAREELQALRALHQRLQHLNLYEPKAGTLQRLRSGLIDKVQTETRPQFSLAEWLRRQFVEWRAVPQAGMAIATLLVGIFAGRQFFSATRVISHDPAMPEVLPMLLAQRPIATARSVLAPHFANVHAIRLDPATGQIEIEFSTVNNVFLRGSAEDPMVRQVLAYAMRPEEQTGLRLRAVKAAGEIAPGHMAADNELTEALLQALQHDTNDGVRLKTLEALKKLPAAEKIKDALIQILLNDTNPAVRVQAVEALSRYQSAEKVSALEAAASSDSNGYVRLQAGRLLDQIRAEKRH